MAPHRLAGPAIHVIFPFCTDPTAEPLFSAMKKDIHPEYHADAVITCGCGAEFHVGSTKKEAKVSICAKCHPFFTGKQRFVDTAGRVDRFLRRYQKAEAK